MQNSNAVVKKIYCIVINGKKEIVAVRGLP